MTREQFSSDMPDQRRQLEQRRNLLSDAIDLRQEEFQKLNRVQSPETVHLVDAKRLEIARLRAELWETEQQLGLISTSGEEGRTFALMKTADETELGALERMMVLYDQRQGLTSGDHRYQTIEDQLNHERLTIYQAKLAALGVSDPFFEIQTVRQQIDYLRQRLGEQPRGGQ